MSNQDPVQDLVEVLRRALTSTPTPAPPATTSAFTTASPSPSAVASPIAKPAPFTGSVEDCNGFLLQCSLVLEMQPHLYPDDRSKVAFIISQLDGKALRWAEPLWTRGNPVVKSLSSFINHFKEVFGKSAWDSSIANALLDSGSAGNFISRALCCQLQLKTTATPKIYQIHSKDGGLRPCIDYRALNKITVKFRYPLPLVPSALKHLRGATVFTKLDLRSAYNLIRIREGNEWKTAFVTPTGHYEYLFMPYGLVNAPSVFQDFMHEVLREFLHKSVLVYIDDILIYSRSMADHRQHIVAFLQRLRDYQLFLKAEKCTFHQPSVQFLGYNIDRSGIRMDERKVTAVKDWPIPTSVKELQRFLGFANFCRQFIQGFSSITSLLTSLLRNKPKSLSWTPAATQAFDTLKTAFTTAPLLAHPDPDLPFVVAVDASTTGVGAVLSQQQGNPRKLHPCAFFSRKLNPAE
ncbi:hypothetical protein QTP70_002327, partial [Hemibagrus guttatus]